jgi:hypothetical protein
VALGEKPRKTGNATSADLDLNGQREKVGGLTFGAITSGSYHPGGVNVLH